jgi:hypothetical protein
MHLPALQPLATRNDATHHSMHDSSNCLDDAAVTAVPGMEGDSDVVVPAEQKKKKGGRKAKESHSHQLQRSQQQAMQSLYGVPLKMLTSTLKSHSLRGRR